MSDFLPCNRRQNLIAFQRDGSKTRVQHCAEETAEKGGQRVTPEDCAGCSVRAGVVTKAIRVGGFNPPLPPRLIGPSKSQQDREKGGLWPECKDRQVLTFNTCCGGKRQAKVCKSLDSTFYGSEVSPVICTACECREAKNQ